MLILPCLSFVSIKRDETVYLTFLCLVPFFPLASLSLTRLYLLPPTFAFRRFRMVLNLSVTSVTFVALVVLPLLVVVVWLLQEGQNRGVVLLRSPVTTARGSNQSRCADWTSIA